MLINLKRINETKGNNKRPCVKGTSKSATCDLK